MRLLPSKRSHLFVLERSRIYCRDGRVEYVSDEGREALGFNIPIANTMFVLLGPGSSITQEAVRLLRQEGVCIGFCGSGGTPLLSAQDPFPDLFMPADEYRDPGFLHRWIPVWQDQDRRLAVAREFMRHRVEFIDRCWSSSKLDGPFPIPPDREMANAIKKAETAQDSTTLLGIEGQLTRSLYASAARSCSFDGFQREHGGSRDERKIGVWNADPNRLLDHGNYLAYGLASVVLWTLGIPASLSVLHGQTRRGGLVFDVADIIKDGCVLPTAFNVAARIRDGQLEDNDAVFRSECLNMFLDHRAMDVMFQAITDAIDV